MFNIVVTLFFYPESKIIPNNELNRHTFAIFTYFLSKTMLNYSILRRNPELAGYFAKIITYHE
jgi:hypothetical protein